MEREREIDRVGVVWCGVRERRREKKDIWSWLEEGKCRSELNREVGAGDDWYRLQRMADGFGVSVSWHNAPRPLILYTILIRNKQCTKGQFW